MTTDTQNPTGFDLFKDMPQNLNSLSPEKQFEYMTADPELQRAYLSGDMAARVTVETATKNYSEWQQQQKAAELREATAKHEEFLKSLEEHQQTKRN